VRISGVSRTGPGELAVASRLRIWSVAARTENEVWRCTYPVVLCPKYRCGVLVGLVETRLKALLRHIASEVAVHLREIEVMPDHIHVLMDVDPQFGVQRVVRVMKGRTSRVLRSEFGRLRIRLPTPWTNSHFVYMVDGALLENHTNPKHNARCRHQ
jgi:putative transposase